MDDGIEPGTNANPSLFHIDNWIPGYHTFLFDRSATKGKSLIWMYLSNHRLVRTR
jgi:hypothetical protein